MINSIISERYAKALLQSSQEEGVEDRVLGEAQALAEALGDDRDVRRFLTEPLSSAEDKLGVLLSAFPEPPHTLFKGFLRTVMENRRERFLPLMLREFLKLSHEGRGELKAGLTTAFKLSKEQKRFLEKELSKKLDRDVELIPMVDRSVLGGASLQLGDTVYDGTLRTRLMKLEQELRKEPKAKKVAAPKPAPVKPKKKPAAKKAPVKKKPAK